MGKKRRASMVKALCTHTNTSDTNVACCCVLELYDRPLQIVLKAKLTVFISTFKYYSSENEIEIEMRKSQMKRTRPSFFSLFCLLSERDSSDNFLFVFNRKNNICVKTHTQQIAQHTHHKLISKAFFARSPS